MTYATDHYYRNRIRDLERQLEHAGIRYDEQLRMHLTNASRAVGLLRAERVRNQQLLDEIAELRSLLTGGEQA